MQHTTIAVDLAKSVFQVAVWATCGGFRRADTLPAISGSPRANIPVGLADTWEPSVNRAIGTSGPY